MFLFLHLFIGRSDTIGFFDHFSIDLCFDHHKLSFSERECFRYLKNNIPNIGRRAVVFVNEGSLRSNHFLIEQRTKNQELRYGTSLKNQGYRY